MARELKIATGEKVVHNNVAYIITSVIDEKNVVAIKCGTKIRSTLPILELRPIDTLNETTEPGLLRGMPSATDKEWAKAEQRKKLIEPLIDTSSRTRAMVADVANRAGVSAATIYNWIGRYNDAGLLSSLLDEKRDGGKGRSRLSPETETIVDATIRSFYLEKRKGVKKTCEEIEKKCKQAGLVAPHIKTIYRRIDWLTEYDKIASTKGRDLAEQLTSPKPGRIIGADTLLSMVQIDHMNLDIVVVDDRDRLPIGRAWLTLAIEVFSRIVAGMYVSLDPPSAFSAGMCIVHAILPKDVWLQKLGVEAEWPCWGKMTTIHMDNAREFRGNLVRRACKEYGIDPVFRPVKKPRYGAHIERLLGTVAEELKSLPGATFSKPDERGNFDSDGTAALTFKELETYLANYFAGDYHQRKHSELDMPPIQKWREGIFGTAQTPGRGIPSLIQDENRLRLDFLPYTEKTVQAYGVQWEKIHYYDDFLRPWYHMKNPDHPGEKLKFRFHYDPRDISVLYFFDPKAQCYYRIPYRDLRRKPMSVWEREAARRKLKADGVVDVNEDMIFRTHEILHQITENAVKETKKLRRERQRKMIHGNEQLVKPEGKPEIQEGAPGPNQYDDIEPYEDIDA